MFYKCFTKMATIKYVILGHEKKNDGTWNLKLRVTHNRKSAYISMPYYVDEGLVSHKNGEYALKEKTSVFVSVMRDIVIAREYLNDHGAEINVLEARDIADILNQKLYQKKKKRSNEPELFSLAEEIKRGMNENTMKSTDNALNRLAEYLGKRELPFTSITCSFLEGYERWLQSRTHNGKKLGRGILTYLSVIRKLYNVAVRIYNSDERVLIPNNPYARFRPQTYYGKQHIVLDSSTVRKVMQYESKYMYINRARDVFMISFFLCGANTADIYDSLRVRKGRIEYERHKTRDRRSDRAFLSIKIEDELRPYLAKYKGKNGVFSFRDELKNAMTFNAIVNKGLKVIGEQIGEPELNFYCARRAWATIARNECHVPLEDVAFSLAHNTAHKVTEIYIGKDYGIIDRANRKVIDAVLGGVSIS